MSRIAIAIIVATLTCATAVAQETVRHEFSVNAGGGASGLQTKPTLGDSHWKWTSTAGLGYQYFFNPRWGIGTGINFTVYNGGISISDYNQQQTATNAETGHTFDFMVTSPGYGEKQQATMITIPLMAQYQYRGAGKTAFYTAAFGFKAGIPVSAKTQSEGAFTTKGYYPDLDITYENLPDYGFATNQPFPEDKTAIGIKTAVMVSVEAGVKWPLDEKASLYIGIYTDCGLNNVLNRKTVAVRNLTVYQSGTPSQFAWNTATDLYAGRMAPFAVGVTVRWVFHAIESVPGH